VNPCAGEDQFVPLDVERLDPELRGVFEATAPTPIPANNPERARARFSSAASEGAQSVSGATARTDRTIAGQEQATADIGIRVYEPSRRSGTLLPAVLFVHGGGFVVGSVDDFDEVCDELAAGLGLLVASVEYRLAPEHPAPAAVNDCYAALLWLITSAGRLGVDPDRVALVGESAGGGIAAGVALMARDAGVVQPVLQMLLGACLDDRHQTASSYAIRDARTWNRSRSIAGWSAYVGDGSVAPSPYTAPARATELGSLPPTYIATCEFELMRDENIEYARRLIEAGVSTELHVYPRSYHGFETDAPTAQLSIDARRNRNNALERALRPQR
jgi:acetyl esterase/lipase